MALDYYESDDHYDYDYYRIVKLLLRCPKTEVKNNTAYNYGPEVLHYMSLRLSRPEKNPTCCINVKESILNASWDGDFRAIRGLLQCPGSGANVNTLDIRGRTPLYIASLMGYQKAVEVLLHHSGVRVNMGRKSDGGTPFSIASERAHFHVMQTLVMSGKTDESRGWCRDNWVPNLILCDKDISIEDVSLPGDLMSMRADI